MERLDTRQNLAIYKRHHKLPEEDGWPAGMHVSVYDAIRAVKGRNVERASKELERIQERYGDNSTLCRVVRFRH